MNSGVVAFMVPNNNNNIYKLIQNDSKGKLSKCNLKCYKDFKLSQISISTIQ